MSGRCLFNFMIQRIQTIYLFVAATLLAASIFSPFAQVVSSGAVQTIFPNGNVNWMILLGLGAALAFTAIFLYQNRRLQVQLTLVGAMASLLSILLAAFTVNSMNANTVTFLWGWTLPLIAMFLLWLAARAIRKDEEKVRSMNRLR
jgi:Domain of unknown function (DUF4293)